MAGDMNRVTLIGRLGKDPEIRATQAGKKIASVTLATSESWNDRASGEKKERTEWHRVVFMSDGLAGVVERYVKKGSKILVEGSLQTRKWTDQSGAEKYTTEIIVGQVGGNLILLDSRDSVGQSNQPQTQQQTRQSGQSHNAPSDLDDDIPF